MDASAIGVTHPDTNDSLELINDEAIRFQCYLHNGLIVVAKFGFSIQRRIVDGIEICHEKMIISTFNI